MSVTFATFCYSGDAERLHAPGQLRKQVESNNYAFDEIIVVYQQCDPSDYEPFDLPVMRVVVNNIDAALRKGGVDPDKPQFVSNTDKIHQWKYHVVNHLQAVNVARSDYIVFADADCWMVSQPPGESWINHGITMLETNGKIFIVSPNDGEPERVTQTISQQMFLVRRHDFLQADFNQPGWDGNPHVPGGPFPEYHAMLEGRIHHYCKHIGKYRYVLPPEFRYWHFNRSTQDGQLETDLSKY